VAAGDAGKQFIADLSSYTGADVAAATHDVGSADLGGSWTLDASTGPIEASAPFTADALTSFSGTLPGTIDGQLWYTILDVPGPAPGAPPGTPARKVGGFFNSDGTSFTPAGGTLTGTDHAADDGLHHRGRYCRGSHVRREYRPSLRQRLQLQHQCADRDDPGR
jgi:hypothetical protein